MDNTFLRAIHRFNVRAAIGSSSMRNAGSSGVVRAVQGYLNEMPLDKFGTRDPEAFLARLDLSTEELVGVLPNGAQHWGLARKGLNIFLRGCLYTVYLREEYGLAAAEEFFEMPLDSITGDRLVDESDEDLPPWRTIRGLDPMSSATYQAAASRLAAKRDVARVHLDALWWGGRQ